MVKGMIPGASGSVVNVGKIEEGDEVRAFFRVRGNKVKKVTVLSRRFHKRDT